MAGLAWCFTFVVLEAVQAVFLGGVFQRLDAFLLGSIVFGLTIVATLSWTWAQDPGQFARALANRPAVIGMNLAAAAGWIPYFIAVQLIEPAIAFAVFSGSVPLATIAAARLRIPEASSSRNLLEAMGNVVIALSLLLLAAITLSGLSGFVRGGLVEAGMGLVMAAVSGASIAWMLFYCQRLDRGGVSPATQFGLRFLAYVILSMGGVTLGLDYKGEVSIVELSAAVAIGLFLIAFPSYAVQRAVALVPPLTIAAVTALGPLFVFAFQLVEQRVDYAWGTLSGLGVYFAGAVTAMAGAARIPRYSL